MTVKKTVTVCTAFICVLLMTGCSGGGSSSAAENSEESGSKILWSRTTETEGNWFISESVHADDDGVYIAGLTDSKNLDGKEAKSQANLFVRKYDKDGAKQWSALCGNGMVSNPPAYGMKNLKSVLDDGSLYCLTNCASSDDYSDFSAGMHFDKINAETGAFEKKDSWGRGIWDGRNYIILSGISYSEKFILAAGYNFSNNIKTAVYNKETGSLVFIKELSAADVNAVETAEPYSVCFYGDSLYLTGKTSEQLSWDGQTSEDPDGKQAVFTARFSVSEEGELACTKIVLLMKEGAVPAADCICGHDGYIYISGTSKGALGEESFGTEDIFVAKYSADLSEFKWVKQSGEIGTETSKGIVSVSDNGIYAAADNGRMMMMKFDFDGNKIWSETAPGNIHCSGAAAACDGVYFSGTEGTSAVLIKCDK